MEFSSGRIHWMMIRYNNFVREKQGKVADGISRRLMEKQRQVGVNIVIIVVVSIVVVSIVIVSIVNVSIVIIRAA